jgi:hypothetical protein
MSDTAACIDRREVKAVAAGAAAVGAYMLLVLASGRVDPADFALLLLSYVEGSFAMWLAFAAALGLILLYRKRPVNGEGAGPLGVLGEVIKQRWQRDRFASWLWPPLLFGTLMASFNAFKQLVLPAAGFRLDPLLAELDRRLFFGHDPWRVIRALIPTAGEARLIDAAYHAWFAPMAIGVIACAWLPASTYRLRTQYLLSYVAIWVGIGSLLAFLLPSAGPCFYDHFVGPNPGFTELMRRLADAQAATGSQFTSLAIQSELLSHYGSQSLIVGAGISAMPSVHNALSVLFALAAFKINRIAGWVAAAYAVLIWLGSIYLGWHYAIDGLAAALLTLAIWPLAGLAADRLACPSHVTALEPAAA